MSIIASTNSTPRELIPAGNYVARCYSMIQIGTVTEIIQGISKQLHKVRIAWEFPNDKKTFSEEKGPQPIVYDEEYTLSMAEKSNLRKMLASWRGKDFTQEEVKSFDVTKLIGVACMVNIIHKQGKADPTKVYSKIGSVSSVPKDYVVPPAINPVFVLSYDNFDWNKFNSLPDFIKDKMKTSNEYKALTDLSQTAPSKQNGHADGLPAPSRNGNGDVIHDAINNPAYVDDLPF